MGYMIIKPNANWLIYKGISQLMLSAVAAIVPLLAAVFYFSFMVKLGREMTTQDTSILLYVYSLSFILIYVVNVITNYFYVVNTDISIEENGIVIRRSFIGQNKGNVPFVRISSIEVNQSVFERIFGLGTLFLYIKNNNENHELPGFKYSDASSFADIIMKEHKLNIKKIDA